MTDEELSQRCLKNAYDAVTRLDKWNFFDLNPPEDKGYMWWFHPTIDEIAGELDSDGHSGFSMGWTMRWMQSIRQKGWNKAVKDYLDSQSEKAGVMNLAFARL